MKLLFREKLQFNNKRESCTNSIGLMRERWCKWEKNVAWVFGLIAFLTLVGIVIYNLLADCTGCDCHEEDKLRMAPEESQCEVRADCDLSCESIHGNELSQHIMARLFDMQCATINLDLKSITFENRELNPDWLSITPNIRNLVINNCDIKEINENSFSAHPFKGLQQLWIVNTNIETLRKHSFLGLNTLVDFAVRLDGKYSYLTVEERALEGMSASLAILQLTGFVLGPNDIINLTGSGGVQLSKLLTISLNYNIITELPEYAFEYATNAVALYLHGSSLSKVHANSLWGMRRLELLHLNGNSLTTLPPGSFEDFARIKPGYIHLGSNQWNCECPMQWLQTYYIVFDYINKKEPPECPRGESFEKAIFCPTTSNPSSSSSGSTETKPSSNSGTSPDTPTTNSGSSSSSISWNSTSSSTSSATSSTTQSLPEEPKEITIKCKNTPDRSGDLLPDLSVDSIKEVDVTLEDGVPISLTFKEISEDPFLVVVEARGNLDGYHLIWFEATDDSAMDCVTPLQSTMTFYNLKHDTTYIFSLLPFDAKAVSPKNCFSLRTEPEWQGRSWITNQYQSMIISIIVVIVLCLICIAILFTYLCIRRFPKLIRGNKNVIIVKKGKSSEDGEETPKEYERPAYWEPYPAMSSHGYLTPKYHKYAKVRYRPPLVRSISEWSFDTSHSNYTEPTRQQLQAWKTLQVTRHLDIQEIGTANDYRPPLPPPNPNKRNTGSSTESNETSGRGSGSENTDRNTGSSTETAKQESVLIYNNNNSVEI